MQRPLRIAMVAGEMSGDLLGAGFIKELKQHVPRIEFMGIGGPQMIQQGFNSCVDMSRLSVMGIGAVLWRYAELWRLRSKLIKEWLANPPDVFIGIDAPAFNLGLETRLKAHGIKTVHMVSPKIWAWRQKRVFTVKKAVDLMLTLFPFEEAFYRQYEVPVKFIGHPLADLIAMKHHLHDAKKEAQYNPEDKIITVLPGSRACELKYLAPLFLDVMKAITQHIPEALFIVPTATPALEQLFNYHLKKKNYNLNITIATGQARQAMSVADVILTKAGTATLEAMLLKRPMVVAFKWGALTHAIINPQIKVSYMALPNLLVNRPLVPEFFQKQAQVNEIAKAVINLLNNYHSEALTSEFSAIHSTLRQNSNQKAVMAVLNLLEGPSV